MTDDSKGAAGPEDADLGCHLSILNNGPNTWSLKSSDCSSGGFTRPLPSSVPFGPFEVRARGTHGSATGCVFQFTYALDDDGTTVTVKCDIPYIGDDSFDVSVAGANKDRYTVATLPDPVVPSNDPNEDYLTADVEVTYTPPPPE